MKTKSFFGTRYKMLLALALLFLVTTIATLLVSFRLPNKIRISKNQLTDKQHLGHFLFFDNRLSYNQQKSCASCHDPKFCFTDGYRTSSGTDGYNVKHNAPSLINASLLHYFTWADSGIHHFEDQMKSPLFNTNPSELGLKGNEQAFIERLSADPYYKIAFKKAFPLETFPININNTILAIAAFESTLISFNSAYDSYRKGNLSALNKSELAGMRLFFSDSLNCAKCHDNPSRSIQQDLNYANTGLYNIHATNSYPLQDQGLFEITNNLNDQGKFRIPSLKNVLLTAPYTHDGSVATIQEMLAIYAAGGRNIESGNFIGDGRLNKNKSGYLKGFKLNKNELTSLIAFLNTFTDTANLRNIQWIDPFKH